MRAYYLCIMAPVALKKLTALQTAREAEMESMRTRLLAKPRESLNKKIVQARIDSVKEIWSETRKTHSEIIVREDAETDAYVADKWFERIQGIYENAIDEFLTLLTLFDKLDGDTSVSEAGSAVTAGSARSDSRVAKLPRISLPTFSGQYEDWSSFSDLFTSLVHDVPDLSDGTKLQYLKLCLTGGAAELIKDVKTTNANYASTWQALKARYHNPRLIIKKLLTSFMEIPHLKTESASELSSFVDAAQRVIRALENLKLPVEHWDVLLVFLLSDRLDPASRKLWEAELSEKDQEFAADEGAEEPSLIDFLPKFSDLVKFAEKRVRALGMATTERKAEKRPSSTPAFGPQTRKVFHASSSQSSGSYKCPLCSGAHALWKCYKLKEKDPNERLSIIRRLQVCYNCFGLHKVTACTSAGRCSTCRAKHHTLLHLKPPGNSSNSQQIPSAQKAESTQKAPVVSMHAASISTPKRKVLLATARVQVVGPNGESTYVRALLDQGSEVSFVSESIVQLLGLPKERTCVPLSGLGASAAGTARSVTQLVLRSSVESNFELKTEALVLPRLTSQLPANSIRDPDLKQVVTFTLADPEFFVSKKVDVILGADVYGQVLRCGLKRFPSSQLVAQNTAFGWIISGALQEEDSRRAEQPDTQTPMHVLHCVSMDELDQTLQRFWALEDLPSSFSKLKPEDEACENLFKETHSRDSKGRYEVRLPLKGNPPSVGVETMQMALGSLTTMHRRFARDPTIAEGYRDFMGHYEQMGHMTPIPASEVQRENAWYLPHHAVVQASKLRVVFDASRRTRDGQSLNDFLFTGAPLQSDLSLVLLNWRRYLFAFTADMVKMFRQIRVKPEDQDLQRIVWAPTADSVPVHFRLTTVTYGTACAPFLAIRTLLQLVEDEGAKFPNGAECLKSETYVDDTFAGADELSTAVQKRVELMKLLDSAGISLDKWAANHPELLPPQAQQVLAKQIDVDKSVKTLGVHWNPAQDQFRFNISDVAVLSEASTKRSILSSIARLFDPLGWLSPITVTAKILLQDLWIQKCEWDSPVPAELRERWYAYCKSLSDLPSLSMDRWLGVGSNRSYQIHGFSDASSRAYAAAVYLRINEGDDRFSVSLLAAKSKVAPVKTVSIPNLELCGAALLVKLVCHVRKLDFLGALPVFAWSDSQIVLNWLRKHPCHWKTFVANRVSYIQTELPSAIWAHVSTKENPADLATRGSEAMELSQSDLWWRGPSWLSQPSARWPKPVETQQIFHTQKVLAESELLSRFSSLSRLIRVLAFCRRPLLNTRRRKTGEELLPSFLTSMELADARLIAIRLSQASSFPDEIETLQAGRRVPKRSRLSKLNPLLCENKILRVGGRLAHSNLSFDRKHPPILAQRSALSLLFVRSAHSLCLHGGLTLTSSVLMQQVWLLGRKDLVKSTIHKCVTCQRIKPRPAQQLMGDLPADRVNASRPFAVSGLDYAGPIQVRTTKGRGHRSYKGYIVVFVCFSTRAIHLELVSDLTTATFISAYRRFVGRRGVCRRLYSDNATNFHGADNELQAMFQRASDFYQNVASVLANDGTDWVFIPPSAPHYGGLWEAGVKSVKHHLKRVVGEHTLTFEELSTVLVEIEACLNSRPLGALSSDVDDLNALTPFHFLNGAASALLPDADLPDVPENRLDRFQLLQRIRNQFWKRWSTEYLLYLQQREKWRDPTENFSVGRLVLIQDDRYPPSKWPLGRIAEVHPGPDGLVRVATVKTATTSLRRHIARLCPLHIEGSG